MEDQQLVSPSQQCSSTPDAFGHGFLSKELTTMEHSPYSPDLTSPDFCLFSRLKSAMKGWRFCDATELIKNAMKELKRFSQSDFQACFKYLYSRWRKCRVAQGDYFECTVA
jgi:hypothetical protein